jgi:hypothetical protein
MKRLDAANDNDAGKPIARTREVWQPRLGRDLTDEAARQIMHNVTGFFVSVVPIPPSVPGVERPM